MVQPNHLYFSQSHQILPPLSVPDFTHNLYSPYEDITLTDRQEECSTAGFELQDQHLQGGADRDKGGDRDENEELGEMKVVIKDGDVWGEVNKGLGGLSVVRIE
jgi:hypothetical protein